jgi:hypothetical protein
LKVIFGILAVLVAVLVGLRTLGGDRRGSTTGTVVLSDYVTDETTLIRVFAPGGADSARLERIRGVWTVNGYPADSAQIAETLDGLRESDAGRVVARSPDNHARMGVTDEAARRVEIGAPDAPDIVFLLGGSGTDGRYIRRPDAPEVYSVDSDAVASLDGPAVEWRDRLIAAVDTAAATAIVIRRDGSELRIDRSAAGWSVEGAPADSAAMQTMLETLADLEATGFPPDSVVWEYDFEAPNATIEVLGVAGPGEPPLLSLLMVRVGEGPDYLVREARSAYSYALSEYSLRPLLVDRSTLLGQ